MLKKAEGLKKRSVAIAGHRTSISLEEEFWAELKQASLREGRSVAALIAEIDKARGPRNLSSAIRVYILKTLQNKT
ncbi:MAG: ribbon-helix-helix domain-containing protein [Alphaproteobacteria bacterium]|nr:ribbon-helix-helix domain-containing protein [Alphaproteobacteria bacterium]